LKLTDLLNDEKDLPFSGITADSRKVKKGSLFAALPGSKSDGNDFIPDALSHGASFILGDERARLAELNYDDITLINHENPRWAFAKLVAKYYKAQPVNIVAVTGTSGKTSVVSFVQQIWHLSGIEKCASLGTLGVMGPNISRNGGLTTPDTESLHANLADLAAGGIDHLALEASSHGLDQYRLDGVQIAAAAYTNLSRDHLDYHDNMDEYFEAKSRLFSEVMQNKSVAVINSDDDYAPRLIDICKGAEHKIISFGTSGETIKLLKREPKPDGQDIVFTVYDKTYELTLPLVGEFQVMNALCALGLVLSQDDNPDKYAPLLDQLNGVPGRLQFIDGLEEGAVYVDYAHKPAALEMVLKTLRPHTQGRLIVVFGCGGNRDVGKRSIMGKIAADYADKVIVTDDNPRYEDPVLIRQKILESAAGATEIADRHNAIESAIVDLKKGDVLIVAGKGHEKGQIVGDDILEFDDVEEVKKAIEKVTKK
jgi:UDP-N-acetylmuramoyl-L-alanyl-D-glutamate--2,6-diaminopimelate ligase